MFLSIPWKSGIRVSKVVVGFILRMAFTVSIQMIEPPSFKSSRSTLVTTACLMFIILIERATFSGSSQSTVSGLPVFTPQNPQERVHVFPKIMNVAVPSPQHSPMFGQLPEVQIVFKLYLSTKPRSSVYFFPIGSFTFSHFGLATLDSAPPRVPTGNVLSKTVSIFQYSDYKNKECSFRI